MLKLPISKKELLARTLDKTGMNRLIQQSRSWSGLVVLNYHRIGDPGQSLFDWNLWSATPEGFDQQVQFAAKNFDVISANDLPQIMKNQKGRYVLITFDDGYRDNFDFAFPILKSYGVSGTFFLATGFLDNPTVPWWDEIAWMIRTSQKASLELEEWNNEKIIFDEPDRNQAIYKTLKLYKSLEGSVSESFLNDLARVTGCGRCPRKEAEDLWMTWDMIREMTESGMCFGGHTVHHPVLSRLSESKQWEEIQNSGQRIEQETGKFPVVFSYPVGGPSAFTETTRTLCKKAGYLYSFSYYGGYSSFSDQDHDHYDMPRIPVEMETSPSRFRSLLTLPGIFG